MKAMGQTPTNRYEIDEKNAIIALQAILTTRGVVAEDKYQKFSFYLSRLPPQRSLLVYGHAMHAIANRMEEENPYKDSLKKLGQTITDNVTPDFAAKLEDDLEFFESQRQLLAENLNKIATLMQHFRDKAA